MKTNSIRLRVIGMAVASIVVTIAVAGVSLVFLFERQVLHYLEHDLNIRWTELATAFALNEDGIPELRLRLTDPRYHQPYGGAYWQVSENGAAILRSRSLWDKDLPSTGARPSGGDYAVEADGPNGSQLYAIEREVTLDAGSGRRAFRLAVALDHAQVAERRLAFGWDVARVLVPIGAVLVLFAWLQIWLGLRPLRTVGEQLNAVQTGRIRRMSRSVPAEIAPLVDSINSLLDRQETLVRKARDRAGNLAHGLKTPVTILAGEVRRLEQHGLSEEAKRIQEQLTSIRNHVDREVARARTSGGSVGCGAYTAVEETIARLLRLMQHMPGGDRLVWHSEIPPDLGVNMDPHDFGEVVGNLLDNARKWAAMSVTVRVDAIGGKARIAVEDDGPGFSSDGARPERGIAGQADTNSSGLGLGIVEEILAEYGTKPVIVANGRTSVSFEIPTAPETVAATARSQNTATAEGVPQPPSFAA
jgi:signal transduction histidine kinase